ncbi:D-2-hydroxyacid dehydrogenase [Candidatus Riflebacteria bacterium]
MNSKILVERDSMAEKIVVLDGYTLEPEPSGWRELKRFGELQLFEVTLAEEVVQRCRDATIVLTNKVAIRKNALSALAGLKYIGVMATGYNVIDVEVARDKGIIVTNVPHYGTESVAQTTLALLLELTQRVGHHASKVKDGHWSSSPHFTFRDFPLIELYDRVMGIIGMGRIGKSVARIAAGFGMRVLGHSRSAFELSYVEKVELHRLLQESDVISLHCPLNEETKNLINKNTLAQMKPEAFLLNTARGQLLDEDALYRALKNGQLKGAALDVLQQEPPDRDNPLFQLNNCVITPHFAWGTVAARKRLMNQVIKNLESFLVGVPINVVN